MRKKIYKWMVMFILAVVCILLPVQSAQAAQKKVRLAKSGATLAIKSDGENTTCIL